MTLSPYPPIPLFLIIGSGIAGLNFALNAANFGKVLIITKKRAIESNTNRAQGGIAGILDKTDNPETHIKDTLEAGAYHNDKKAVEFLVRNSTKSIYKLMENGVPFSTDSEGNLLLTKEGGHSARRIAFVGDYTGAAIEKTLLKNAKKHPNITIYEHTFAVNLIMEKDKCYGVKAVKNNKLKTIFAENTVMATGGIGQIYRITTNPSISTGDGIAMAFRAGAALRDLEFIQFHPTALNLKNKFPFLLSETLRGEGAYLLNYQKKRFMHLYHRLKELAPRDTVARAIFNEEKKGQVYLDFRHKNSETTKTRFPRIYEKLKKYNLDLTKNLIPISPAAHYICGGIKVNLQGRVLTKTKKPFKNLFAFGEVTCTGVHGANRLASNSLLEAAVFSDQILNLKKPASTNPNPQILNKLKVQHKEQKIYELTRTEKIFINKIKKNIQETMWNHVGIVRTKAGLKTAIDQLKSIGETHESLLRKLNEKSIETDNMLTTALLITKSAQKRKKPLGGHYIE